VLLWQQKLVSRAASMCLCLLCSHPTCAGWASLTYTVQPAPWAGLPSSTKGVDHRSVSYHYLCTVLLAFVGRQCGQQQQRTARPTCAMRARQPQHLSSTSCSKQVHPPWQRCSPACPCGCCSHPSLSALCARVPIRACVGCVVLPCAVSIASAMPCPGLGWSCVGHGGGMTAAAPARCLLSLSQQLQAAATAAAALCVCVVAAAAARHPASGGVGPAGAAAALLMASLGAWGRQRLGRVVWSRHGCWWVGGCSGVAPWLPSEGWRRVLVLARYHMCCWWWLVATPRAGCWHLVRRCSHLVGGGADGGCSAAAALLPTYSWWVAWWCSAVAKQLPVIA
jgi:hypothetical protein